MVIYKSEQAMDNLEKLAKKKKRKNLFKTVSISILSFLVIVAVAYKGIQAMVSRQAQTAMDEFETLSEIAYPNISVDSLYFKPDTLLTGVFHADRFKDIDGVMVEYGDYEEAYTPFATYYDLTQDSPAFTTDGAYDRGSRTRLPMFFNVNKVEDDGYVFIVTKDEIGLVKEMENQLVEVALTFDKDYTYAEIQEMLPDNLKVNFYWIGTDSDLDTASFRVDQLYGLKSPELTASDEENEILGWAEMMIQNMQAVVDSDSTFYTGDYDHKTELKNYIEKYGEIDFTNQEEVEQMTFAGVILTGKAENFEQLESAEWLYASSIGASVQNQPYYDLEAE